MLNPEGHPNRITGSKVTAILLNGGFCPLVELHWEGSAPAACAAGLFLSSCTNRSFLIDINPIAYNPFKQEVTISYSVQTLALENGQYKYFFCEPNLLDLFFLLSIT